MTAARCATKCGRPARGGTICPACSHELGIWLRQVPAVIDDLETSLARQTASGRTEGGRSSEKPAAYGVKAGEVLRALSGALLGAARALDPLTLETGQLSSAGLAAWLVENISEVRASTHARTLHRAVKDAMTEARGVIDRRPDRWYAGACGFDGDGRDVACAAELYADVDDEGQVEGFIRCPTCGEQWNVQDRRDVLHEAARDQLAKASTLAAALTYMGQPVDPARIRQWAKRQVRLPDGRRFKAVDLDEQERPLYRVGDAMDLIAAKEAEVLASQNVDESPSNVVESSRVCHTPSTGTSATPKVDEGSRS